MAEVKAATLAMLSIVDQGIAVSNAIDLFVFKANKEQYSSDAAAIVGEVQTFLINSKDSYASSTMSVYRWCQTTVQTLQGFTAEFESISDPEAAKFELTYFKEILKQGHLAMDIAINELEKSNESFNKAAGKITTLSPQLKLDFAKGSTYYNDAVARLTTEAYATNSTPMAYLVLKGELIPNLEKTFDETKALFKHMETMCTDAQAYINKAKKTVGTIMAQIKTTDMLAKAWSFEPSTKFSTMFDMLNDSTNKLIAMCESIIRA